MLRDHLNELVTLRTVTEGRGVLCGQEFGPSLPKNPSVVGASYGKKVIHEDT